MNLFALLAFVLVIFGLAYGALNADAGGWAGTAWGAAKGAAWGFGAYVAIMLSIMTLLSLGLLWRPPFPRCRDGCCKGTDFKYLSFEEEQPFGAVPDVGAGGILAECGCGTRYLRRNTEGRCWQVASDGTLIPFMRHSAFGRWRPD